MNKKTGRIVFAVIMIFSLILISYLCKPVNVLKEIEKGNFYYIDNDKIREQLEKTASSASNHVTWIWRDINADNGQELILVEKDDPAKIIGVFAAVNDKAVSIIWDDTDVVNYYELCEDGLLSYSQYYGVYDMERYELYQYDDGWNAILIKGLEIYFFEDISNASLQLDNEFFSQNNIDKEGGYYLEFEMYDGKKQYKELAKEEWLREFQDIFGKTYDGEMPAEEPIYYSPLLSGKWRSVEVMAYSSLWHRIHESPETTDGLVGKK